MKIISILSTVLLFCTGLSHAADPCDRKCLESTIDKVLDAMIAHNPDQLMLAKDVSYTVPYGMKSEIWDDYNQI
jgi:hypothetical protein